MLEKLTSIWMVAKSLSCAKSLELFSTQSCGKENSKLCPSFFYFPPHLPLAKHYFLAHTHKRVFLSILFSHETIVYHFIPIIRGFFRPVP